MLDRIRVECTSGCRGEESPRRFWLNQRCIGVEQLLDRWLSPEHGYFKVLGDDRAVYILRHDVRCGNWELTFFSGISPSD